MSCKTSGSCKGNKLVWALLIVAIVVAIFSVTQVNGLVVAQAYVSHFFEVMVPILAVAALLKYLCTYNKAGCACACCANGACDTTACEKTACEKTDSHKGGCC